MTDKASPPPLQWDHEGACTLPGSLCEPDDVCARCGYLAKEHPLYGKPPITDAFHRGQALALQQANDEVERLRRELSETRAELAECNRVGTDGHTARLLAERDAAVVAKDGAYRERDMCVAFIANSAKVLGCRVGLGQHDQLDADWGEDWRTIVFVDLPTGQVSWHIHDSERVWFASLRGYDGEWDGHDTEEKYRRVLAAAGVNV